MPTRPRPFVLGGVLFLALITSSIGAAPTAADDRAVVVRAGQTLGQIASAHGVSVDQLVRLNHLADPNRIYVGQRLRLRASHERHPVTHERSRRLVAHRVAYGETLSSIARQYHLSVDKLVRRNRLHDASHIYAGQLLRIRMVPVRGARAGDRAPRPAEFVTHVVRFAETLSGIALRYHVSLGSLAAVNHVADPSFIRVGQQLRIPSGSGGGTNHRAPRARPHYLPWRMPAAMAALVHRRATIGKIIRQEAVAQHVSPALAMAVAWQESGWQERIVSSAGAIGLMQLLPSTADWVSASMLGQPVNLWNARSNARAGIALLQHYLRHYRSSRPLTLAAYYQGQAGTDRHGIYPTSRPYVDSILILEAMFHNR
jgi:LysM repeat protein